MQDHAIQINTKFYALVLVLFNENSNAYKLKACLVEIMLYFNAER